MSEPSMFGRVDFQLVWDVLVDGLIPNGALIYSSRTLYRTQFDVDSPCYSILLRWLLPSLQSVSGIVYILGHSSTVRFEYARRLEAIPAKYMKQADEDWSMEEWEKSARDALNERNGEFPKSRTTTPPAIADWTERIKPRGKLFDDAKRECTRERIQSQLFHGNHTNKNCEFDFNRLDEKEKVEVYKAIIEKSGTPQNGIMLLAKAVRRCISYLVAFESVLTMVAMYMGIPAIVAILPWFTMMLLPWDWRRRVLSLIYI